MQILSTRETTEQEESLADKMGFQLLSYPVLRYEFLQPPEDQIESLREDTPHCWVFTSKNGVEGFLKLFEQGLVPVKPHKIFAVGKTTAAALKAIDFEAEIPEVENGKALATMIINDGTVGSVIHFCGNLRRDELSGMLRSNDISVKELIVYKTITGKPETQPPSDVQAILFYSPSAVDAFVDELNAYNGIPLVAIGSTTAKALQLKRCDNIIEAREASTGSMLKSLKKFLKPH